MELIDKLCYLADTSSVSVTHMQLWVTGWSKCRQMLCRFLAAKNTSFLVGEKVSCMFVVRELWLCVVRQ